jgi:SEC-C motif-containing protein
MGCSIDCYCCSLVEYSLCCEPFILGLKNSPTAETLMRSRYTAFCLLDHHYLTRTVSGKANVPFTETMPTHHWVKLEILNTVKGTQKDHSGTVQFNAFFKENNTVYCLNETSQFKKINGLWFYVDGLSTITNHTRRC